MLKMGCAKADITPEQPVFLHGYAYRNRLSSEVEDPVEVGVIALEQDGATCLLLTADSLGIEFPDVVKICRCIAAETGIGFPNIMISCSHTHFAPNFNNFTIYTNGGELPLGVHSGDASYYDFWMSRLMPAVKSALADLEEVVLLQTEIPVSGIAFNRRTVRKADGGVTTNYLYPRDQENYDFSPIDTTMHVWKFMCGDVPKAVLARYGCHPVTGGKDGYGISADYPGAFRRIVEEKLGCPGFFMLGTAGDVVPMLRGGSSRRDIGEVMAAAIRLAERSFRESTGFNLKCAAIPLRVKSGMLAGKSVEEIDRRWQEELEKAQNAATYNREFYMAGMMRNIYHEFNGAEADLYIQLIQLGDVVLAGLPFEVLTAIGTAIREVHPDAAIISCCGGYECYLPLAADFPKGGYETSAGTVWDADTGNRVVEAVISALKEFKTISK